MVVHTVQVKNERERERESVCVFVICSWVEEGRVLEPRRSRRASQRLSRRLSRYTGTRKVCLHPPHSNFSNIFSQFCSAADVLASPVGVEGPHEIGFRETKISDPNKARQAERLGMGVGRVG